MKPEHVKFWLDPSNSDAHYAVGAVDLTVDSVNKQFDSVFGARQYETTQQWIDKSRFATPRPNGRKDLKFRACTTGQEFYIWYEVVRPASFTTSIKVGEGKDVDPVTARLMAGALPAHGKDYCTKCGWKDLHFYRTVLRCSRCLHHVGGC